MKNNKKTLIKGIILLMLVAVIGTTYAYFAANITGNESTSTIVVTGGTMEIVYDNLSGTIEAYDIYPRNDAWVTKNFTVTGTNTTDKEMRYKVGLTVDNNTFSKDTNIMSDEGNLVTIPGALTYSLTSVNTSNKGSVVSSKSNQPISYLSEITLGTGSFPKGEDMVHTYTFELFFKDTGENQNADQGKTFAGHIIIEEVPYNQIALSASNLSNIGYTNGTVPSSLVIPEKYQDANGEYNQVTSIADNAFTTGNLFEDIENFAPLPSLTNLTNLTLNEGLESIGDYAFTMANNLTSHITIPSTVKTIGHGAFSMTGITGLTLNEGLESIGPAAFVSASNLTGHITIPGTVKNIGLSAFGNTGITGLTLKEGLIYLSGFVNATNLTGTITIPSTVRTIGEQAFNSSSITGLILNEGVTSIGDSAFSGTTNLTGHITIPGTVKNIELSAFSNTGITDLTLNEGLETIGESAFQNASNLTGALTIPSTVKTIGERAFIHTGITTINYRGSEAEWDQIDIGTDAFPSGVTINYNYLGV